MQCGLVARCYSFGSEFSDRWFDLQIFCAVVEPVEMDMFLAPLQGGIKRRVGIESGLATGHEEVKTRVEHLSQRTGENLQALFSLRKKSHTRRKSVKTKPANQRVSTAAENKKENSKSISALSFSSWHVVSLCPANATDSAFMLSFCLPV